MFFFRKKYTPEQREIRKLANEISGNYDKIDGFCKEQLKEAGDVGRYNNRKALIVLEKTYKVLEQCRAGRQGVKCSKLISDYKVDILFERAMSAGMANRLDFAEEYIETAKGIGDQDEIDKSWNDIKKQFKWSKEEDQFEVSQLK